MVKKVLSLINISFHIPRSFDIFKLDPKNASIAVLPSKIIIFGLIISTCSNKNSEYLLISFESGFLFKGGL